MQSVNVLLCRFRPRRPHVPTCALARSERRSERGRICLSMFCSGSSSALFRITNMSGCASRLVQGRFRGSLSSSGGAESGHVSCVPSRLPVWEASVEVVSQEYSSGNSQEDAAFVASTFLRHDRLDGCAALLRVHLGAQAVGVELILRCVGCPSQRCHAHCNS